MQFTLFRVHSPGRLAFWIALSGAILVNGIWAPSLVEPAKSQTLYARIAISFAMSILCIGMALSHEIQDAKDSVRTPCPKH